MKFLSAKILFKTSNDITFIKEIQSSLYIRHKNYYMFITIFISILPMIFLLFLPESFEGNDFLFYYRILTQNQDMDILSIFTNSLTVAELPGFTLISHLILLVLDIPIFTYLKFIRLFIVITQAIVLFKWSIGKISLLNTFFLVVGHHFTIVIFIMNYHAYKQSFAYTFMLIFFYLISTNVNFEQLQLKRSKDILLIITIVFSFILSVFSHPLVSYVVLSYLLFKFILKFKFKLTGINRYYKKIFHEWFILIFVILIQIYFLFFPIIKLIVFSILSISPFWNITQNSVYYSSIYDIIGNFIAIININSFYDVFVFSIFILPSIFSLFSIILINRAQFIPNSLKERFKLFIFLIMSFPFIFLPFGWIKSVVLTNWTTLITSLYILGISISILALILKIQLEKDLNYEEIYFNKLIIVKLAGFSKEKYQVLFPLFVSTIILSYLFFPIENLILRFLVLWPFVNILIFLEIYPKIRKVWPIFSKRRQIQLKVIFINLFIAVMLLNLSHIVPTIIKISL